MTPLRWLAATALAAAVIVLVWLYLPSRSPVAIPDGMSSANAGMIERGAYLVRAASCVSCHWDKKGGGQPFAGGRALATPFGTFYSPNLTPDKDHGIGGWTDEEFVRALTHGEGHDGKDLYPVFPYTSYARVKVEDALAMKAYLATLTPVPAETPGHEISFPFSWRALMKGWKLLFLTKAEPLADDPAQDATWNRGRYLVEALGHCGECHTPRNLIMVRDESRMFAGGPHPEGEGKVPGMRGLIERGRYKDQKDLATALQFGEEFGYENMAAGGMRQVQVNMSKLPQSDIDAIAEYLISLK